MKSVAMVTITTPWRQQWEADWEGREGKVALERKLMAGMEEDVRHKGREWRKHRRRRKRRGEGTEVAEKGAERNKNRWRVRAKGREKSGDCRKAQT